ncbi:TonB-dependent hemoglobin/transferrin/lactoferrin family receptor [Aeromonas veronii]|uniref:TonB-dependent hemoglobin/transferrin/lactoferrin family receptor n=1 Tax=Aeromonas veronii TaxID=654 RepID=UPI003A15FB79
MNKLLQAWPALLCASAGAADLPPVEKARSDDTIIVTGQRVQQKLSDVSGSITVITQEELDRQVASELTHVFRKIPGVSVTGSAGRPQNISVRGIGGNRILLIKDGVRVSDGFGADNINDKVGRFNFDLDDIKQIEVAKGAGSSLHGSDAIGGTVVMNTKQPEDYLQQQDSYLAAKTLYGGDSNKKKLSMTGAVRAQESEHLLRLSGWRGNETANFEENRIPADLDGMSASTSSRLPLNAHHALRLELDYYEDHAKRQMGPKAVPQPDGSWDVVGFQEDGDQRTQGGKFSWEANDLGMIDTLNWSLFGNQSRNEANQRQLLRNDALSGYPRYRSQRTLSTFEELRLGSELELQSKLSNGSLDHTFSYGVELEQANHERPVSNLTLEDGITTQGQKAPFSKAETRRDGIWLSDVIDLGNWQFTPTLRFDRQRLRAPDSNLAENHSDHISPSVAASYRFNETWRSWLSYANGFRAPAYDQVYGNIPHYFAMPPFEIIANPNLKEETSHSLEWGVNGQSDNWSVKPAVFYNRYYNFIDWRQTGFRLDDGVFLRQYRNVAKAETWGAELAASLWLSDEWELSTNLAWMDGKDHRGEPLRTQTPLEGNTTLRWQQLDWGVELSGNYAAAMTKVPQCANAQTGYNGACQSSAGWFSLDLTGDWQITEALKVNATIGNLLDTRYVRYQDVAGLPAGSDTSLYSQSGRYLSASLSYRFVGI